MGVASLGASGSGARRGGGGGIGGVGVIGMLAQDRKRLRDAESECYACQGSPSGMGSGSSSHGWQSGPCGYLAGSPLRRDVSSEAVEVLSSQFFTGIRSPGSGYLHQPMAPRSTTPLDDLPGGLQGW